MTQSDETSQPAELPDDGPQDTAGTQSTETPDTPTGGTAAGDPTSGAEISEEDAEHAVVPSEDALEAEGPQAGHA